MEKGKTRRGSLNDNSGGSERHGNRAFLLLCAEGPIRGLGADGPVCRTCDESFRLRESDANQRILLDALRSVLLVTPPPATTRGALTLPPGSPPAAVVLRAKHIRATLAALDAASTRFWVDSLLARHLPILFNEAVWSTGYEIVPTPENKECCIISPGEPPRPHPASPASSPPPPPLPPRFPGTSGGLVGCGGLSSVYLSTRSLSGAARIE